MLLLQVLQKRQLASTATHVPVSLETCRGTGVRGKFVQLPGFTHNKITILM